MRSARYTGTSIAATLVCLFAFTHAAPAEANVKAQLKALQGKEALKKLLAPGAADDAKRRALSNLAGDLAAAGLIPKVDLSKGSFDDEVTDGQARFKAPVLFNRSAAFVTRVRAVGNALGASATGTQTVCFDTPDKSSERFKVSKAGEQALVKALGASGITPIAMHRVQMNGRVVVLSGARFGDDLYDAVRARAAGGAQELALSLTPLPEWQPVRLSLTTTEGQRVTIPVELDGADRRLEVSPETRWVIGDVVTEIPFDQTKLGQIVLLGELMRRGSLKLTEITQADFYPVDKKTMNGSLSFDVHLIGANGAWYASRSYSAKPTMRVQHTGGACSLSVRFGLEGDTTMDLGWQPLDTWDKLSSTKVLSKGASKPVIGYLKAPTCASEPGGLSGEAFDKVMERPKLCKALCSSVSKAARGIDAVYNEDGEVVQDALPAQSFSTQTCAETCVQRSAYETCLQSMVRGDARSRYKGLLNCETRRKISK